VLVLLKGSGVTVAVALKALAWEALVWVGLVQKAVAAAWEGVEWDVASQTWLVFPEPARRAHPRGYS
jgi:hypothetical protein